MSRNNIIAKAFCLFYIWLIHILVILTPVTAKHCRWMFVFVQDFPVNGSNYAEIIMHLRECESHVCEKYRNIVKACGDVEFV